MAKQRKGPKYLIPTPLLSDVTELKQKPVHQPVRVSFEYLKVGKQHCLSNCQKEEVRAYLDALRMLTTMSWLEVLKTGGRPYGGKAGLGYTPYPDLQFSEVSHDVEISGLRAGGKLRLFGYHLDHVYYVIRFDPKHEIVPAR